MKLLLLSMVAILPILDNDELKEKARKAFDSAEAKVLKVEPDVVPDVVEKCPCNGTGIITHGDGHKTACPGTSDGPCKFRKEGDSGRVAPVPVVLPEHGIIIMESLPGCLPCEKIKKSQLLKDLISVGWRFKVISPLPGTTSVPKLTAMMGGKAIPMKEFTNQEIIRVNNTFRERSRK